MLKNINQAPIDSWRKTVVLTAKKRNVDILDTSQVRLSDKDQWGASLASIHGTPFIAVGCGSKKRNFYILEHTAPNKLESSGNPTRDALKVHKY